jgi:hypothetical protein
MGLFLCFFLLLSSFDSALVHIPCILWACYYSKEIVLKTGAKIKPFGFLIRPTFFEFLTGAELTSVTANYILKNTLSVKV